MMTTYASGTAALQFPSHYVPLTEEEMTYVDGGVRTQWLLFKSIFQAHFTHSEINRIWNGGAYSYAGEIISIVGLAASSVSLLGAALVAAKYEMKAADKINGGRGAYLRIVVNGGRFSGLTAITPW